jgi:hypothetical protein
VHVRLLTAALAALALAAPAEAAVPRGFYGVSYDRELRDAPAGVQSRAWSRMAANGVESARSVFSWSVAQPTEGAEFDFGFTDRLVADAVEHGIDLLPIVTSTPLWARGRHANWWPKDAADFAAYVSALVTRYGADGTFWSEHPEIARRPLRQWQIYNEPGRSRHYGPLLRAAHRTVHEADAGAKIVLAGLTGTFEGAPWDVLRYQYRHGWIQGRFDIAAIQLYTGEAENVARGVRRFRRVMKRHGDGKKPIWMTEFGITASKGRTDAPSYQRTLRTTDEGMASFLEDAYRSLARRHRRLGLKRAYWYTWASSYHGQDDLFDYSGLVKVGDDGASTSQPALRAYRRASRR